MSDKSLGQRLEDLNKELTRITPGYCVKVNMAGRFNWKLVGPDGHVCYDRDSFDVLEALALHTCRTRADALRVILASRARFS